MSLNESLFALSAAKAIQKDIDAVLLPPEESAPARSNAVLPYILVKGTRRYIEVVVHQVNRTYENACYDACAVMLRRLIETLIIEAFEAHNIADHIKNPSGDYLFLRDLIGVTLAESAWNLTRGTRQALPRLKDVGDKSAHSRRFNAIRHDIDHLIGDLRIVVEELIHLAKLK